MGLSDPLIFRSAPAALLPPPSASAPPRLSLSHHTHQHSLHGTHLTRLITQHTHLIPLPHSGWLSCGRRKTQSLLSYCARGRRWPRLAFVWQAQYTEPPGGPAARVGAAGPQLAFVWQAQYTEPSRGAAVRVGAAGPRLAFVSQALCVNVVPGSRDRRRHGNLCWCRPGIRFWQRAASASFGVAVTGGDANICVSCSGGWFGFYWIFCHRTHYILLN